MATMMLTLDPVSHGVLEGDGEAIRDLQGEAGRELQVPEAASSFAGCSSTTSSTS